MCHAVGDTVDEVGKHRTAYDARFYAGSITITSVTFPTTGAIRPTINFTLRGPVAPGANPTTGALLPGLTTARATIARLLPATTTVPERWQSYKNTTSSGGFVEATYERARTGTPGSGEGQLVDLGNGNYSLTMNLDLATVTTPLAVAYDATAMHRIGLQNDSGSNPSVTINNVVQTTFKANGYIDVAPNAQATLFADSRQVVTKGNCNNCHGLLNIHGRRYEIGFCNTCHNPGTMASATESVDLGYMTHRIHMGKELPSVIAGGSYKIGSADFSKVGFPRRIADCTVCHGGAQGDYWKTKPTIQACTSCHDDISFVNPPPTGKRLHTGGAAANNNLCAACHPDTGDGVGQSVTGAHANPLPAEVAKFQYVIESVANTAPGQFPEVVFKVQDPTNANALYDLKAATGVWAQTTTGASRLQISFAWGKTDLTNEGSGQNVGQPVGINALGAAAVETGAGSRVYKVTSTVAVPANMTGSGLVTIDGHPATLNHPTLVDGTRIPVPNLVRWFAITDTAPTARRAVVSMAKCNTCHGTLSLHGNNRQGSIEACYMCHNTDATDIQRRPASGAVDGKAEASIDLKYMIHSIHSGGMTMRGGSVYTAYGFGNVAHTYDNSASPNPLQNCGACHEAGRWNVPDIAGMKGTTTGTGASRPDATDNLRLSKGSATCSGCHANPAARGHMYQMGGTFTGATQSQIDAVNQ